MTILEDLQIMAEEETLHGLHPDVSNEVYHDPECPGVSNSRLKKIAKSYMHYKAESFEKTKAMVFGSAVHESILEPHLFDESFMLEPKIDRRTKVGKEQWKQFKVDSYGKETLSFNEMSTVRLMKDRFMDNTTCRNLFDGALYEQSAWTTSQGLLCKCRPDIYRPGEFIADIKTTQSAYSADFRSSIAKYGYDHQAAFYQQIIQIITGERLPFYFIVMEKEFPFGIAIYELNEDDMEVGRELVKRNLEKLSNAIIFREEMSYPEGIQKISMPMWAHDLSNR